MSEKWNFGTTQFDTQCPWAHVDAVEAGLLLTALALGALLLFAGVLALLATLFAINKG